VYPTRPDEMENFFLTEISQAEAVVTQGTEFPSWPHWRNCVLHPKSLMLLFYGIRFLCLVPVVFVLGLSCLRWPPVWPHGRRFLVCVLWGVVDESFLTVERWLTVGPEMYVTAAKHFFRALKVYPNTPELLDIYKKTVPEVTPNPSHAPSPSTPGLFSPKIESFPFNSTWRKPSVLHGCTQSPDSSFLRKCVY